MAGVDDALVAQTQRVKGGNAGQQGVLFLGEHAQDDHLAVLGGIHDLAHVGGGGINVAALNGCVVVSPAGAGNLHQVQAQSVVQLAHQDVVVGAVAGGAEGDLVGLGILEELLGGGVAGFILVDGDDAVIGDMVGNEGEVVQRVVTVIAGIQIAGEQGGPIHQRDGQAVGRRLQHLLPADPAAAAGGVDDGDGGVQFLLQIGNQHTHAVIAAAACGPGADHRNGLAGGIIHGFGLSGVPAGSGVTAVVCCGSVRLAAAAGGKRQCHCRGQDKCKDLLFHKYSPYLLVYLFMPSGIRGNWF